MRPRAQRTECRGGCAASCHYPHTCHAIISQQSRWAAGGNSRRNGDTTHQGAAVVLLRRLAYDLRRVSATRWRARAISGAGRKTSRGPQTDASTCVPPCCKNTAPSAPGTMTREKEVRRTSSARRPSSRKPVSKMEVRLCSLMVEMRCTTRTRKIMRSALRCSTCNVHKLEAREIGEHGRLFERGGWSCRQRRTRGFWENLKATA